MNYRQQITERFANAVHVERMIRAGELSPAARDMSPADALWQWQEANALSDHLACVELARF